MRTNNANIPSPPPAAGEGRGLRSGKGEGAVTQERSLQLRKNPTEAEDIFWQRIRNRQIGGCKFRRQYPVDRYIPDFVCFEPKVIIEIDGGQHNESVSDKVRDAYFGAQGFRIIRFWNNEIVENIEGVMERLARELNTLPPHPSRALRGPLPSPAASGGEGDIEAGENYA